MKSTEIPSNLPTQFDYKTFCNKRSYSDYNFFIYCFISKFYHAHMNLFLEHLSSIKKKTFGAFIIIEKKNHCLHTDFNSTGILYKKKIIKYLKTIKSKIKHKMIIIKYSIILYFLYIKYLYKDKA